MAVKTIDEPSRVVTHAMKALVESLEAALQDVNARRANEGERVVEARFWLRPSPRDAQAVKLRVEVITQWPADWCKKQAPVVKVLRAARTYNAAKTKRTTKNTKGTKQQARRH